MIEVLAILGCLLTGYLWIGFLTAVVLTLSWNYMSWPMFACIILVWPSFWRC